MAFLSVNCSLSWIMNCHSCFSISSSQPKTMNCPWLSWSSHNLFERLHLGLSIEDIQPPICLGRKSPSSDPQFAGSTRALKCHLQPCLPRCRGGRACGDGNAEGPRLFGNRLGRASTAVCFLQKNVCSWYVYSMYRLLFSICSLYFMSMLGYIIKCYENSWRSWSWGFFLHMFGSHLPHLPQSSRASSHLVCSALRCGCCNGSMGENWRQWEAIGGNGFW